MIKIIDEIKNLPCFIDTRCTVELLTGGDSHACFKVTVFELNLTKKYFAKSFFEHQDTASAEISSNLLAADVGLTPSIIYHSPLWLVSEFIVGDSLANFEVANVSHVSINKAIIAMNLMVKIHQLAPSDNHQVLDIARLLNKQKNQPHVTPLQLVALNITISKIAPKQAEPHELVLCHGDVNYGNIRLNDTFAQDYSLEKTWLVDYECSYLAEVEYDIAMFIAVNEMATQEIDIVIASYEKCANINVAKNLMRVVNKEKVRAYLACCYLINGLWYYETASEKEQYNALMAKARQQFNLFDQLALLAEKVSPLF